MLLFHDWWKFPVAIARAQLVALLVGDVNLPVHKISVMDSAELL